MSQGIRKAIQSAHQWLREHPDQARYTDSLATARLESGLRVRVTGPNAESLDTDMPAAVGGAASAMSPGWAFRAALAACVVSLAAMRAAQQGMDGFGCEVDVDSESDDRGILGLDPDMPAGPLAVRIRLRMTAPGVDHARLEELAAWAVAHCPVSDAVQRVVPVTVELV
ncbi:MAG TPA: OsmC family protein [Candidatus Limnocylindria bacterium]|nr:OsmC family protein [Candidatus Limnocylindria bacterium]